VKERGPGQELTLSFGSSFFCNQVFFVYDPSSSTSLLSSVSSDQGGSVREVMVVMVRGPLQELTLGRLALVGVPTDGGDHGHHDGGDHHRWPRLATPAHVLGAAAADVALLLCRKDNCCCNFKKCFAAAGPALGGSSQAPPPSSCDLLRPGLL